MIAEVIQHIDAVLDGMPFFSENYGFCELKTKTTKGGQITQPIRYVGGKHGYLDLNQLGFTYWRQTGNITIDDNPTFVSGKVEYETTAAMRLFAMTKRSEFPENDAYSAHRLAATLIKALTIKGGKTLKDPIQVRKLKSVASLYSTNSEQILQQEFTGIPQSDFKKYDLVVAIDVNLIFVQQADCIIDACNYTPTFCLQLEDYIAIEE